MRKGVDWKIFLEDQSGKGGNNMVTDNDKYILSSVDNALTVLNLFFVHEELTATEIAKILGTNTAAISPRMSILVIVWGLSYLH